ncbi:MAG: hypothetical protein J5I57_12125 [Melioribacteraceae bacterium]|nr:hypothetical protein [Melioribacteraceae bacterium]
MSFKKELIKELELFADILEYNGENKFKVAAFRNGANNIRRLDKDIKTMFEDGSLEAVKGVGKGLLAFIKDFIDNGTSTELNGLLDQIPGDVIELFNIRGMGARKVKQLVEEHGIKSIPDLEHACREGRISEIKGFGAKTEAKLLAEIEMIKESKDFLHIHKAMKIGNELTEKLQKLKSVKQIHLTGELRRIREVISKIEIIVLVSSKSDFLDELPNSFNFNEIESLFNVDRVELSSYAPIRTQLFLVENSNLLPQILFLSTGEEKFIEELQHKENIKGKSEEEIFSNLQMPFIIPEMREQDFLKHPEHLRKNSSLSLNDFKGFFHFHTTYSDGMNTLEEMVTEGKKTGFKYFTVCDHSKTAFYANGLDEKRIEKQRSEIDEFNRKSKAKVYQGIESDILRDGSLDYEESVLKRFDFIVASIHSIFTLSEDEMTNRIIKAVENPYTDLLAHPTGRLLLSREGYKVNIQKVIDACVANDVAIEINANPYRLDLDWRNFYYAREKGCRFSINPDAHSVDEITNISYGISIARKGGIQPEEIINCFSEKEFNKFINRKVKRN